MFKDKCERCHGPGGLGDGPDADPDAADMDLTNAKRADRNSDGVMYYKVWNGRKKPKMPAFSAEITEQQAWAVVAYAQSSERNKPSIRSPWFVAQLCWGISEESCNTLPDQVADGCDAETNREHVAAARPQAVR